MTFHEKRIAEKKENGKWKFAQGKNKLSAEIPRLRVGVGADAEIEKWSDKEIQDEEQEPEEEKDGGGVDAAARESRERAQERNRYGLETGLSADGVERAGGRVAGEIAAEKGKLVLKPQKEITAAAPHRRRH